MKNIALVLAGGVGTRVGAKVPKQFILVDEKPILIYSLEIFERNPLIDSIVLVCVESYISLARAYCEQFGISKLQMVIPGGEDFTHSCMNGMDALRGECGSEDNVLVVAADRPFISQQEIEDAIACCNDHGSGIPVQNCALCMFRVDRERNHSHQYERENLVQIQSPWTFKYGTFLKSLDKYRAGILPHCENYPVAIFAADGNEVFFVKGDPKNIKITEKTDIALMKQMLIEEHSNES